MAGDGEVLCRTQTGTKLGAVNTAKGIPTVTRHPLPPTSGIYGAFQWDRDISKGWPL
jgi:hypothetical protein